jgi:hypothetical protein
VAVDRAAAARIESRTATAFQTGMNTPLPPKVRIHGFPALPQAASGTLDQVDVTAHDIPAGGSDRPLPVTGLVLEMDGLTKSDDDREARARSAGRPRICRTRMSRTPWAWRSPKGTAPVQVGADIVMPLGERVTMTTTVSAVSGNRIAFQNFRIEGGELPAAGQALLDKVFAKPFQLRNIPEGLRLRSVATPPNGLSARFSGDSVTFRPDEDGTRSTSTRDNSPYGHA